MGLWKDNEKHWEQRDKGLYSNKGKSKSEWKGMSERRRKHNMGKKNNGASKSLPTIS